MKPRDQVLPDLSPADGDLVTTDPVLAEHAASIRSLIDRAGRDTVEIGRQLAAAKDRLPHGAFGPWLDREFGWTVRTAQKLMRIAKVFGGKSEAASLLGTETMYALAADTTPEDVRAAFVARAEAGESVALRDVRAAVKEARMLATVDLETGEIVEVAEREAPDLLAHVKDGDWTMADLKREMADRGVEAVRPRRSNAERVAHKGLVPMANVPPEVRRVAGLAHDVTQRLRLLRSQHEFGRLSLGIEGEVFAGELEVLRDEIGGFAADLRRAMDRKTEGTDRGRATS